MRSPRAKRSHRQALLTTSLCCQTHATQQHPSPPLCLHHHAVPPLHTHNSNPPFPPSCLSPCTVPHKRPKGKTLHEIEAEEGGPVKESMVGMAAVQRAIRRKKKEAGESRVCRNTE